MVNEDRITLESLMLQFTNSKKVFRKDGEFTKQGAEAYGKMIAFIYDLFNFASEGQHGKPLSVDDVVEYCDDTYNDNW